MEALDPTQLGWRSIRRGLVNNLLNPKAALLYITVMPSFLLAGEPALGQTVLLGTIYVLVATAIHIGVVLLGGALHPC